MSVKIWDSESQAFKETQNVPRRYDAVSGAYVDTIGKAYNQTDAAWTEKWSDGIKDVSILFTNNDDVSDFVYSSSLSNPSTQNGELVKSSSDGAYVYIPSGTRTTVFTKDFKIMLPKNGKYTIGYHLKLTQAYGIGGIRFKLVDSEYNVILGAGIEDWWYGSLNTNRASYQLYGGEYTKLYEDGLFELDMKFVFSSGKITAYYNDNIISSATFESDIECSHMQIENFANSNIERLFGFVKNFYITKGA